MSTATSGVGLVRSSLRALRGRLGTRAHVPFLWLRDHGVPIPQRIYQHLHFVGPMTVACPGGRPFEMVSYGDYLENVVYWEGVHGYEPECIHVWDTLARQSTVILDIGANTGLFALLAASLAPSGSTVVALEPVRRIADRLRRNVALNPHLDIDVLECAAGAENGQATLHDPGGDNCYSASLNPTFLSATDKTSYLVEVATIDSLAERSGWSRLDLVKLDVEGFEEHALAGMQSVLERHRPALLMEFLSRDNQPLVSAIERLVAKDYVLHHVSRSGVRRSDAVEPSPDGMNVLLLPRERRWVGLRIE